MLSNKIDYFSKNLKDSCLRSKMLRRMILIVNKLSQILEWNVIIEIHWNRRYPVYESIKQVPFLNKWIYKETNVVCCFVIFLHCNFHYYWIYRHCLLSFLCLIFYSKLLRFKNWTRSNIFQGQNNVDIFSLVFVLNNDYIWIRLEEQYDCNYLSLKHLKWQLVALYFKIFSCFLNNWKQFPSMHVLLVSNL